MKKVGEKRVKRGGIGSLHTTSATRMRETKREILSAHIYTHHSSLPFSASPVLAVGIA